MRQPIAAAAEDLPLCWDSNVTPAASFPLDTLGKLLNPFPTTPLKRHHRDMILVSLLVLSLTLSQDLRTQGVCDYHVAMIVSTVTRVNGL